MIQFNKIWAAAGVAACLTSGVRADSEDAFISYSFAEIGIAHDNFNANGLTVYSPDYKSPVLMRALLNLP
ncbi:hypothetical protein GCM10017044_18460 [Kordiimonas sediminis]|uniref:Uncharacterized protein n=1 Tax=Kordiimonas sediminis TaxID=1735581 RepID=A0A919E8C6_9PROT|nr:hypothetical protein GCM10017044_18460 [Kordiimonas sediminis]